MGTGTDNRTGIFTGISPRTGNLHQYTGVHNVAVICSLSLLISMATVKSLTSTPGLEGSLLRCQGHIGRSDRQRLRVLSVFLFLKPKCLHMLALPLLFLITINSSSSHAAIIVRERERQRERVLPLEWVPVYRYTLTRTGIPYRGNPYRCTRYYRRTPPALTMMMMMMIKTMGG